MFYYNSGNAMACGSCLLVTIDRNRSAQNFYFYFLVYYGPAIILSIALRSRHRMPSERFFFFRFLSRVSKAIRGYL